MFGVHIAKSGLCYVSIVSEKGERLIQAFDKSGNLTKSFSSQATKAGKPFEPYQVGANSSVQSSVRAGGVCFAVGRPGVHSLSRVVPTNFKKWYSQLPCLALSIKKDSVENKPASLLVVSLGKAINGTPSSLCGRQMAYPYFTGLQL